MEPLRSLEDGARRRPRRTSPRRHRRGVRPMTVSARRRGGLDDPAHHESKACISTPSTRRHFGDYVCLMASSCLHELLWSDLALAGASDGFLLRRTEGRRSRSCPGPGPEVGPPILLIFGDVAGWRNGGPRPPTSFRRRREEGGVVRGGPCLTTAADRRRGL